jgi:Ca2+-transporting ATPase
MLIRGTIVGLVTFVGFVWALAGGEPKDRVATEARARTVAFCVLVYSKLFFAFAGRSERFTMPELGLTSNPALFAAVAISGLLQLAVVSMPWAQPVFATVGHGAREWAVVLGLSLVPVTIVETMKVVRARLGWRPPG